MSEKSRQYWAAKDSKEIGDEILKKFEEYEMHIFTSGRLNLWRRSYEYYYNPALHGSQLTKSGEQGEFTNIAVNHYKNLLTHLKTMTTQQRPAFEARAVNSDAKSQQQTILASGLLDYYMREKKLERYIKQGVEHALMFGEGFVSAAWNATSGETYGINPETQAPIKEGDLEYENHIPLDVARDYTKNNSNKHDWNIVRTYENRYTLAAKYPELADRIENLSTRSENQYSLRQGDKFLGDSDDVEVFTLYHKPTDALPEGRLTIVCDSDIVLIDGPLPYREIPVYRIMPEDQVGSIFGYTVGFDLIPVQEAINSLYSTVLTNQVTFGVQNIVSPRGSNIGVTELSGGLNLIEYDKQSGPPQPLNLTSTPPEIFNFITQLEQLSETLSGVNSVARGNPEASLKSGSALALVQSMAIQFSISLQQSYAQLLEDLGTATINILRDFATVPRVAMIAGRSNRSMMKEFKGDDLDSVQRIIVDMGNALSKTTSGRLQLAENLLQNGMVKTPDEYIMVLTTGKLEPMIEGTQAELINIKSENEELADGKQVPVIITDNHMTHIQEHRAILANPEARRDPNLIAVVTAHLQEHLNMLSDPANATMLGLLGQQAVPPQPNQQAMGNTAQLENSTPEVLQQAENVNQPLAPTNPLTGETVTLASGSTGRNEGEPT